MYYKIVVPGPEPGTYLSCHGGTHTWTPGITYGPVPVEPCSSGFHACRLRDLSLWLIAGMVVFEVELTGVSTTPDKVVGSTAKLGRCLGTLTPEGMAEFARRCAERAKEYAAANADAADADAAYAAAYYADAADAAERELQGQDILSLLVP